MNNRFIVDAYAWIEYLDGTARGARVRDIVEDEHNRVYTCAVTIAEIVSKFVRRAKNPDTPYTAITTNSTIINADERLSRLAGEKHAEGRRRVKDFSLADAYVLACADTERALIVTGDPHFKGMPGTTFV